MHLTEFNVFDKRKNHHMGKLKAASLWDIYKVVEQTTGIPKSQIAKHYRIQRVGQTGPE